MKNKIRKFKFFLDFDKELEYLREMNKKGWKLVYIGGGMGYTFVKTEPDEYITLVYADKKEKISEMSAFAAQCGYETIPHTMDGFSNLLYLTGKKKEIPAEFVQDAESKINSCKLIRHKLRIFCVIYILLFIVLGSIAAVFTSGALLNKEPVFIAFAVGYCVFAFIYLLFTLKLFATTHSFTKKIKKLKNDSAIYGA
ncbi:MAG: DUF2812 domain-containing protein [Clostridia bacterium]|nr:DUF2812 domain-containing protein [Clostridia bacterium]